MPEFHEEFEETAADHASAAAENSEPETSDVDAAVGGADYGSDPSEPAPAAGSDASELAEELDGAVVTEDAPAEEDLAAKYLQLAQRTQADFENYKKRAARDNALAQQRGITKLARELLPALDNLERAIVHAAEEDPLLAGIKLVRNDLASALTKAGIESFDPAGETFDPNLHEAVAQFPKDGVEPGIVVEVYQQGYRLGDSVLRPARVVVAS